MSDPLLRAMRHVLLERLAVDGARTLRELLAPPPMLFLLALDETEVRDALDSCRRHRLIEPLDSEVRDLETAEWGLTELGRKATRSLFGSILDRIANLVSLLVISATVLAGLLGAATGLNFDLKELDPTAALALLLLAVMVGQLVVAVTNDRRYRVSRARIAADWERLAAERPLMHRLHTRKRRVLWPGVAANTVALGVAVTQPDPTATAWVVYGAGFGAFTMTQYVLSRWLTAANEEALADGRARLEAARRETRLAEAQAQQRASTPA